MVSSSAVLRGAISLDFSSFLSSGAGAKPAPNYSESIERPPSLPSSLSGPLRYS